MTENHQGQNFISADTVRKELSPESLARWISKSNVQGHTWQQKNELSKLIPVILASSRLLFTMLVLAGLEHLFASLSKGLSDNNLFVAKSFEEACNSASLSTADRKKLLQHRNRIGAVLSNDGHQVFSEGTVLPYIRVNHPKDNRYGGFGVVRRVEIAAGHLLGYHNVRSQSISDNECIAK